MRKLALASLALMTMAVQAIAADWQKVMAPQQLLAMAGQVTIVDIRGADEFQRGSIEGAVNAPYGTWRGPEENPGRVLSDAALTELLQGLGLTASSAVVVVYHGKNETDFGAAARVYWTLKSAGLSQIAILNGGLVAWVKADLPLSTAFGAPERSTATFALSQDWMIDRDGVASVLDGDRDAVMIDARPAPFWKGQRKHAAAARAGTLEGALNIAHDSWFGGNRTKILTADEVLRVAEAAGYRPGGPELVSFCNTGHWAATNWFALSELAGIEGVKLYPESLVGWTQNGGAVADGG
ncbi:MAG: rhodanese-like domain-containing protein [Pseudomonadota bacterium]